MTTPQIVDKRLVYLTPEWKDVILFTTKLVDSLGLEMALAFWIAGACQNYYTK